MIVKNTLNNNVVVKLDPENDFVVLSNGKKLYVDTMCEPEKHVAVLGEIVMVPEKIVYKGPGGQMPWKTKMELKIGDRVAMYYLAVSNATSEEQKRYFIGENKKDIYILITYNNIFAAIRDEKIIPINGYVLVEPCEDPFWLKKVERFKKLDIVLPDLRKPSKIDASYGIVRYVGEPIEEYFEDYSDEGFDIEIGDMVVIRKMADIPVEYEYHATMDKGRKLLRMQRNSILAKI